jgi:type III secretory pathway component EscV
MLGRIGGEKYSKKDMIINVIFLTIILLMFILELTTHFLPTYISIEVSILLVSIKIVWMIYSQHKFNHFLFWILNSLEFRMNNIYSRIKKIERMLDQGNTRETNK